MSAHDVAMVAAVRAAPLADDVMRLAPNIISVRHWDRLLGGLLYAVSPRVDWATLLRRSFSVDVLECPKCHGRLRMIAVITEREPARRILAHLGLPTDPLPVARARDPTVDADEAGTTASSPWASRRPTGTRREVATPAPRRRGTRAAAATCALEMLN